jgi:hypothetical protein
MEHWTERLSDYLDGDLDDAERVKLEAHLETCADCTATLADLRAVVATARRLEARPPERDLWPGIEARLGSRRVVPISSRGRDGWFGRRFHLSFPQLAAAAFALALLSAGAMWVVLRRPGTIAPTPSARYVPEPIGQSGSGTLASFDLGRYDVAVAELEKVLRENRDRLDTTTVRIVEQNLAIIDKATEEARQALAKDPANPYLSGHLAAQMKRKIRVLQRAAGIVTAAS